MLSLREALDIRATNVGPDNLGSIRQVNHTGKEDQEAYDQLGPKTRDLIANKMPVKWSSVKTLQMIRQMRLDPIQHDDLIANQLKHAVEYAHQQLRANPEMNTQNV